MKVEEILESANQKLNDASALMEDIEIRQHKLIEHLHTLLHHIGRLQAESRVWQFRAEEMERERNLWQSRAEEKNAQLLVVGRTAAELAIKTGDAHCPSCGSSNVALLHGNFPTGVVAPDGGQETWYECALYCQACGHIDELIERTTS
jgi:hypothetical protein